MCLMCVCVCDMVRDGLISSQNLKQTVISQMMCSGHSESTEAEM